MSENQSLNMGVKRKSDQLTDDEAEPFFESGLYDDEVTFVFDDSRELYVSRGLLCCASAVFRTMFRAEFKEKSTGVVKMKGKEYEDVLLLLQTLHPDVQKPITDTKREVIMTRLIFFCVICLPQVFTFKPEPCNKETKREVTIPRGRNVFGLTEVLDYMVDVPFRSIYHITTDHYHTHMYQTISTTDKRNFPRRLYFDGLTGQCRTHSGTGTLVDDTKFRITVNGIKTTIVEVHFSTCPERYVISMLCYNLTLPATTCSANKTVIIVRIPEKTDQTGNTVKPIERLLDNFPMKNAADDILDATGLNIGMLNLPLKSVFTFGENSCCNADPGKKTGSACPASACPGKDTGIKQATAMAMVILFCIY